MRTARTREAASQGAANGSAVPRHANEAKAVGAQGVPLSAYPGWDAERGVFVQDDPRKRPSALIKQLAKRRPTATAP